MSMLNMKMINTLFCVNVCVSKLKHEKKYVILVLFMHVNFLSMKDD